MNAQLGTDLAEGPAAGMQVGCTVNVQRVTVTSRSRIGSPESVSWVRSLADLGDGAARGSPRLRLDFSAAESSIS